MIRETLLDGLKTIKERIGSDVAGQWYTGICNSINTYVLDEIEFNDEVYITRDIILVFDDSMIEVCRDWEHYSGNEEYPISHPDYDCAETGYIEDANKWSGEYGRRRLELLDMLIEYLKNEIENDE